MSPLTGSPAQRRRLLRQIERLAEIAIFSTLSEIYRTCGRAGCHGQSGGPKHGPHLQISYCGEKGKTTGYYDMCPKRPKRPRAKEQRPGRNCNPACGNWRK